MEANLNKAGIGCYNKVLSQVIRKEETQESVVPDTMPDISRILETSGAVLIRSKDVSAGKLRAEVNVAASTVYLPDGAGGACCLEVNIPVYLGVEDDRITESSRCIVDVSLIGLSTKMLNPRKVLVKAEICARVSCYAEGTLEYCEGLKGDIEGLNSKVSGTTVTPFSCVTEKTFVLTDEYAIPAAAPAAEEILSARAELVTGEVKFVGSKLVFKGEVKSRVLYDAGNGMQACAEFATGYSQIIETNGSAGEPCAMMTQMLSGAYYEILSESHGRTISMELHVVAQAVCSDKTEISCLCDAYSNKYPMETDIVAFDTNYLCRQAVMRESVRDIIETPQPVLEILDVCAQPGVSEFEGAKIKMPVLVWIVYKSQDGQIFPAQKKFDMVFDSEAEPGDELTVQQVNASDVYVTPASGGAEVRLPVEVTAQVSRQKELKYINSISLDEENPLDNSGKPSMVILKAGASDDLWDIAKDNCSTVAAIMSANALESEALGEKHYILIPKTV